MTESKTTVTQENVDDYGFGVIIGTNKITTTTVTEFTPRPPEDIKADYAALAVWTENPETREDLIREGGLTESDLQEARQIKWPVPKTAEQWPPSP